MTTFKNNDRLSLQTESFNALSNNPARAILNPDIGHIKQDLLFFKNDILKDLRKIEEKINMKLTERSVVNNEQYEAYEKKLDILSTRITHVNTIVNDNTNLTEKLNTFQSFKLKAEDNLLTLNSRVVNIQKESKDSIIKIEKMLEENLKYPGIIGRNSKFSNFRFFVDFVMNSIKSLNDFRDEIQNFDFAEFKRKVHSDLQEFRFVITDNYKNTRRLVEKNIKDFDNKFTDLINNNNGKFEEYDDILKENKNKSKEILNEYEKKINLLEKYLNQKYTDLLNEINNLKSMKNKFNNDIDNIKINISKQEKNIDYIKNLTEKNIIINKMNNTNYIPDNRIILGEKNSIINGNNTINSNNINSINNNNITNNNPFKKLLFEKKRENKISSPINYIDNKDKNINLFDNNNINNNFQNSEEKTNSDNTLEHYTHVRMNKVNVIEHSKSFDQTQNNEISLKNYYSDDHNEVRNTKESLAFTQEEFYHEKAREKANKLFNFEIKRSIPKIHQNKYANFKKVIFPNNYSITNIPNIKIKKVVLPETLNNRNKIIKMSKSSLLDIKGKRVMSSNINPSLPKKYFLQNSENINNTNTLNKNAFNSNYNITKINKQKSTKTKGIKFVESARIIGRRPESKKQGNLNSLVAIQPKTKYNIINSANNLRKNKIRSWSFEKNKKEKDEKTQIGYKNTYNTKNQFKELLLVNAKNMKKNRKIKL